jgi:hypothetical protein
MEWRGSMNHISREHGVRLSPFDRHNRSSGRRGQGYISLWRLLRTTRERVRRHEYCLHRVRRSAAA